MKNPAFPVLVKRGSVTVRIYCVKRGDKREVFTAAWAVGSRRYTKQFTTLKAAKDEATLQADKLAAGRVGAAELTGDDLALLAEARRIVGKSGSILNALETWKRADGLVGADLLRACEHWKARTNTGKGATMAEAATLFLAQKKADGIKLAASYDRTMPSFLEALGAQPMASIRPEAIADYLAKFTDPVTRNTHRKRIVSMFRWCRKRGHLPLDVMTAAERVDRVREPSHKIGIVTPAELATAYAKIKAKAPQYIPALTLASLCGMRRAEVHGQLWEDIDFDRKFVRVSSAKANTAARRMVPLGEAARAWLIDHRPADGKGPVCTNLAMDRIRDICRSDGLDLADNGLRHAWVSARVVVTGNIPETSLEAGNSPQKIHRHYRELMRKEEAEAWFNVTPKNYFSSVLSEKELQARKSVSGGSKA